ncbi:MAG: GSU2403 family nucleotidyltransferase fold protein [Saccharofermentanales bacterium]
MDFRQEQAFWDVIKAFHELKILDHVMIIGSWAEYFYPPLFESDFVPNIRTRDVDFFYRNINIPKENVSLISKLAEYGFVHEADPHSEVSKFYKEDLLELEFLTRVMGSGEKSAYTIKALGIKSEGLRVINILSDYAFEIEKNGYKILIPEPAAYVIQKILTNPVRTPKYKREKDILAVEELLIHIKRNKYHQKALDDVYSNLSKKQRDIVETVTKENYIELAIGSSNYS